MTTAALPIACTLGPGDYRERMAWIAALNRMALRDFTQDGRRLVLTYAPDAAELVRELVRREQDCCAFLTFTVQEDPEAVRLTVEAPAEAGESAAALFEPFTAPETAAAPTTAGITCDVECGCSGKFTGQPISKATSKATGAPAPAPKNRAAGVAAASGATAALACGVCCVLPFALPAAVVANVGGALATFAGLYTGAMWLAMAAVAGEVGLGGVAERPHRGAAGPRHALLDGVGHRGAGARVQLAVRGAAHHRGGQGVSRRRRQ